MKKTIKEIGNEIFALKSALIFCHVRPDGDTLGSAGALCLALREKNIPCDIVCDGIVPEKYRFIPIIKEVLKPEEVNKHYDGHIAVDVAAESLLGSAWGIFKSSDKKFCVDHHISNEHYVKNCYVNDCAANVMNICDILGTVNVSFTKEIATCVLLGIITDTNNFANNNADEKAFLYASKMMFFGADLKTINLNVYKSQSKERAQLYIDVMSHMRFFLEDKLAIITITKDLLEKYNLTNDVTEGFVEFPLSIKGVEVAVSVLQTRDELYKVSFRSKGKANVNLVASDFGGGGHILASGCVIAGIYEEVIEKIVRAVDINTF